MNKLDVKVNVGSFQVQCLAENDARSPSMKPCRYVPQKRLKQVYKVNDMGKQKLLSK